MAMTKQQSVLTMVVLAGLAVAIGCGDGSKHKTRILKNGNGTLGGKPTTGANDPNKTGADKLDPTKTLPSPSSADADKTAKAIADALSETQDSPLQISQFEEGTYTLDTVITHFEYKPLTNPAENYTESSLQNGQLAALSTPLTYGILNDVKQDAGRFIKVPNSFTIDLSQGAWRPADAGDLYVLKTQVVQEGLKLVNKDMLVPSGTIADSMMDFLAGQTSDKDGKTVHVSQFKQADGRIRIHLRFEEYVYTDAEAKAQKTTQAGSKFRDVIFTFKFDKKAATSTETTPTPTTTTTTTTSAPETAAPEMVNTSAASSTQAP